MSALAQAYSLSIIGDSKPTKKVDAATFDTVDVRNAFCTAFWKKVSEIFKNGSGGGFVRPGVHPAKAANCDQYREDRQRRRCNP